MDEAEAHSFRSMAARANCFALEPDWAFATKELFRRMSAPTRADTSAVCRVSLYLLSAPRLVNEFPWQSYANLCVFVDPDFVGCLTTPRSTSGGRSNEGLAPHQALELDAKGSDVWNLKGTTEALWDPNYWPRPWPEHGPENVYRLGSCRRDL